MKKSNILIIAILILSLTGIISSYFAEQVGPSSNKLNLVTKEIMLADYKVIVVQAGSDCNIQNSDSDKVVLQFLSNSNIKPTCIKQSNDTLYLSTKPLFIRKYTIYGKTITKIIAKNKSFIDMGGLTKDSISIESDDATIYIGDIAKRLFINAQNSSFVDITSKGEIQIIARLSKSKLHVNSRKKTILKALLNNSSKLNFNGTLEQLEMKCDSTSSYNVNKYTN